MITNCCWRRLIVLSLVIFGGSIAAHAQRPFQGEWEWAVYAKSRSELPPAYRNEPLRDVPAANVWLKLKQRGNKLTGEYSASRRYLAKLEEGDLEAVVKGKTAELELSSGFGGKLTVKISVTGNRLHWQVIKEEGEHYFPLDVVLRRIKPRR
jgi:hypothetical protein